MSKNKKKRQRRTKQKRAQQPKTKWFNWFEQLPDEAKTIVSLDYYQRPLNLIHLEYLRSAKYSKSAHEIRSRFWQFVPPREYSEHEARELLRKYLASVEKELSSVISVQSIAYWLHLYRRLYPGPIGCDSQPMTIGLTRAVFEAAVQKYAHTDFCDRIGLSKDVPIGAVMGGILLAPEFELERDLLHKGGNQLVLTSFTQNELAELYEVEKAAYEIWRAGANLRAIGKGASFVVENSEFRFYDNRSDELNNLLEIYDERNRLRSVSATGAVFECFGSEPSADGMVFLPTYNLTGLTADTFNEMLRKAFSISFPQDFRPNFIWYPFNLRGFRQVHKPLAQAFQRTYGVELDSVLSVIAALTSRVLYLWIQSKGNALINYWQRGYEGPNKRESIIKVIREFLPESARILDLPSDAVDQLDIEAGVDFWTLVSEKQRDIDLAYSGPHYIFLPFKDEYYFTDYTWIDRRLYDFFLGVRIEDQNYKGEALESSISNIPSILPTGPCESFSGEKKQIDHAAGVGQHLIIAECKAVGKSIGFDRGEPRAIEYRRKNVVERALSEAEEKAKWLIRNPKGRNYDITAYQDILPVGVSPFVEFIPSLNSRYWIADRFPRILTPNEYYHLLLDKELIDSALNRMEL